MVERIGLWAARLLVPLALLACIGALSRLELGEAPGQGLLRAAWRMTGATARVCRDYTEDERRSIPQHMQRKGQLCEQTVLTYRLRLWVDGAVRIDKSVRPGGLRGDRPLFVLEDFPLAPGDHALRVEFAPEVTAPRDDAPAPDARDLARQAALEAAPRYALEESAHVRAGKILLLDLDERAHRFVLVQN